MNRTYLYLFSLLNNHRAIVPILPIVFAVSAFTQMSVGVKYQR
jgi:hypothetical protein